MANITGTNGNDSLVGTSVADTIQGLDGNDTLVGNAGNDTLNGGAGNDRYVVGTGDVLADSGGTDTVESSISWTLGAGFENLVLTGTASTSGHGNALNNVITGSAGSNWLRGLEGNDTISAGAGNDVINMSSGSGASYGSDVIDGGDGVDTLDYGAAARTAVFVDLLAGTASGGGTAGAGSATLTSIENVNGSAFADTITGNSAANFLFGFDGNDTLDGGAGNDRLEGGAGSDQYVFTSTPGAANADTITGFASGADKIVLNGLSLGTNGNFAAGDARFNSGAGFNAGQDATDRVIYNTTTGQLWYDADGNGSGAAQLIATLQAAPALTATDIAAQNSSGGPAPIVGTEANDTIRGTSNGDVIEGRGGDDLLEGALGADTIFGGSGNDELYSAFYGSFGDTAGNHLYGGDGNDHMGGGSENDYLQGDAGDDYIFGYTGNDTLAGGLGRDSLIGQEGGDGADVLLFDTAPDILNLDSVHYFDSGTDKIYLDARAMPGLGATGTLSFGDSRFGFGREGRDADDRLMWDGSALYYDADGSGSTSAEYIAIFGGNGVPADLVATDIVIINGNPGSTATGTSGADSLTGTSGDDTLEGLGGNDTLTGLAGSDRLDGGDGDDRLTGGDGSDTLIGGAGVDTLDGGAGDDWYFGLTGGDSIVDAGGRDSWVQIFSLDAFMGETFEDLYLAPEAGAINGNGGGGANYISGNASNNQLSGFGGFDTLYGGAGNDTLLGGDGNDSLSGSGGDDVLSGGAGNDALIGGDGKDLFALDQAPAGNADWFGDFESGWDQIQLDGTAMTNLGPSGGFSYSDVRFRAGTVSEADADDRIIYDWTSRTLYYDPDGNGAAPAQAIAFTSFVRAEDISVVNGGTAGLVINGTSGDDTLGGTPGADTMSGLGGNDNLFGSGGNDRVDGGDGNDLLGGEEGDDFLDGGAGNDTFYGSNGRDSMQGNAGDDLFSLGYYSGDYVIDGGAGIDTLSYGQFNTNGGVVIDLGAGTSSGGGVSASGGSAVFAGIENATGGWSNDRITGSSGANLLDGGSGDDTMDGGAGNDTVRGSYGNDTVAGGDGDDFLYGDDQYGEGGNDSLSGGAGVDWLDSGAGSDTLTGGAGADTLLVYQPPSSGIDVVTDFTSGSDTLRFDGAVFTNIGISGTFAASDGRFHAGAGASAGHDADDRLIYDTSSGNLYYDGDGSGSGSAQLVLRLQGAPTVAAPDIAVDNGTVAAGGGGGDDALTGGPADDTINGQAGNDTIDGRAGDDHLDGGSGNDVLIGGEGADVVIGGEGNDFLDGATSGDSWYGEPTSYYDPASDSYQNLPGDTLNGGLGDDVYFAQWNDVIVDAGGVDTLNTDQWDYTLASGMENLTYTEFAFGDGEGYFIRFTGNELNNVITIPGLWYSSSSVLDGGDGNDELHAAGGYSTFRFSAGSGNYGNDTLYGAGSATIDFADARSAIVADLNAGTMTGGGTGGSGSAVLHDIHNLIGGAFNDRLIAHHDGSSSYYGDLPGSLEGRGGNDTLEGVAGGHGYDLSGGDGNDRLVARGPQDAMHGGTGADQFVFARAAGGDPYGTYHWSPVVGDFASGLDKIVLDASYMPALGVNGNFSAGDGRFWAAAGASAGHDADDRVIYNTSTNELYYDADGSGGAAALLLGDFQPGAALIATDIAVENGTTVPPPPAGGTTINGTTGNDNLTGTAGNDTINALAGEDRLDGGAGNDSLSGSTGHDTLLGGDGNDTLNGGGWSDNLTGGAGADSFFYAEAGTSQTDQVTDFVSGSDELLFENGTLTALGAAGAWAAGDARFWAAAGATSGHDANDRIVYNTSTGALYYDADGSGAGAAQVVATFTGAPGITATDITVI